MSARRASRRAPAAGAAGKSPPAAPGLANSAGRALLAGAGWLAEGLRGLATSPDVRRLLLLGALGAGVAAASDAARARVEAWPRFEVDRAALTLTPLPPCLSDRARRDLERLPLPPRPHAFDPQLVPFTAACLAGLPWVRQVERVDLDARGQLAFSLVAREPIARLAGVEGADGGALTRDGAVVPLDYAARADALPALTGVPASGDLRARALTASIAVLADLEDLRAHVVSIDLSNLGGGIDPLASEVVLSLSSGPRVDWGRPPADGMCVDGAAKRQALRTVLEGGLDLTTVERISVRWDEVTYALRAQAPAPVVMAAAAGPTRR